MRKKDVVLVSLDALRFDCVPFQTNKDYLARFGVVNLLDTPTLKKVCKESLCFDQAISVGTYTTAAHASVFTGLYPTRHQVRGFMELKKGKLARNVLSMPEVFKANGYLTVMLTDVPSFYKPINLDRGFDRVFGFNDRKLFKFLEKNEKPLFLFAHFFDIHHPYMHTSFAWEKGGNKDYFQACKKQFAAFGEEWPGEMEAVKLWNKLWGKRERQNAFLLLPWYIKGVNKFDQRRLARFVKELDSVSPRGNRVTVMFADHGEGRCNQDPYYFSHAGQLYDSVLRVPLLIDAPGLKPGVDHRYVSLIDIFPTVIDLVFDKESSGLPRYQLDGKSLVPSKKIKLCPKTRYLYCETWKSSNPESLHATDSEWILRERCLRTPKEKFVVFGEPEKLLEEDFFKLPDEEFLKKLYRALFYRFEDQEGMIYYLNQLETNKISKKDLIAKFYTGLEHQQRRNFYYFNLVSDPQENFPLDPTKENMGKARAFLEKILEINSVDIDKLKFQLDRPLAQELKAILKPTGERIEIRNKPNTAAKGETAVKKNQVFEKDAEFLKSFYVKVSSSKAFALWQFYNLVKKKIKSILK